VFAKIELARMHQEISAMQISVSRDVGGTLNAEREELYNSICKINSKEVSGE
jgi:hypothetical protein